MSVGLEAIIREVENLPKALDFDRGGLGEKVVDAAARGILHAMDSETDPDGHAWAPLNEAYADFKSRAAPGAPISVLRRHMTTYDQLRGMYRVTAREVIQEYGTDEAARELATFFQEGNSHQPPRRFYELNPVAVDLIDRVVDARFNDAVGGR